MVLPAAQTVLGLLTCWEQTKSDMKTACCWKDCERETQRKPQGYEDRLLLSQLEPAPQDAGHFQLQAGMRTW